MAASTSPNAESLVIGVGQPGPGCAVRLHETGRQLLILEASHRFGGRVRTETIDEFLLDRILACS